MTQFSVIADKKKKLKILTFMKLGSENLTIFLSQKKFF